MKFVRLHLIYFCLIASTSQMTTTAVQASVQKSGGLVELYVDQQSPLASDSNDGSVAMPLLTINRAAQIAVNNKTNDIGTQVIILPGLYREFVDLRTYTNFPDNQPNNSTPMFFQAQTPGTVIISGAQRFSAWTETTPGLFFHAWTENWGVANDPTGGAVTIADIVLRREIVFVNDQRLDQVETANLLSDNTYFVNENSNELWVKVSSGIDLSSLATVVEVGLREKLWQQEFENNVTISGLVFQHAATRWQDGVAAVRISNSDNATLDELAVQHSNGQGLYIGESDNVILSDSTLDHNGWQGWSLFRLKALTAARNSTSYNNWRGDLGGFHGWSVGNKLFSIHGALITEHTAINNLSRGLWLDTDIKNVVLDNVTILDNFNDAIFLEVSPGPIFIQDSIFCNNGGHAVKAANTEDVTISGSIFCSNAQNTFAFSTPRRSELLITGVSSGRTSVDFETGESQLLFINDWVFIDNEISGTGPGTYLFETTLDLGAWNDFIDTLYADRNAWSHNSLSNVFEVFANELVDFSEWQCISGQDLNSMFNGQTDFCPSDIDLDGQPNEEDNCLAVPNPAQTDSDGDGYGNACDADLNNDCQTNFLDAQPFVDNFLVAGNFATDLNGDGTTNFLDISQFGTLFLSPPGPSGVGGICDQ